MAAWTLEVKLICGEHMLSEYLVCESWDEALSAAGEIMSDYSDSVMIKVIDPRGWYQQVTKPMFRM